ncbi:hypothetical protein NGB36_32730 [Streptomyces sp. RB6PN25]|uniref:Uncharacterized protein n=1 Tax=Streptomyces humicola TaxID=2953240 RepID=A0ABT1Q5J9_9ACTN|nr:hypothetical protein [Streptomyces humicola]MCQ4085199.1 hypothetical protein [Streptomyces humicola]
MLPRLAYLTVINAFAALRLLPMSDCDKDSEILALRHQIMVLERQLGGDRVNFSPEDRASPHYWYRCRAKFCADSGCWSNPTPYCDGTAT